MKILLLTSCIFLVVLFSCKKEFNHSISADNTPTMCGLCSFADHISGQYRGYASSGYSNYYDSLTISIEHIFLNLGTKSDSTIMYFRRVKDFDTRPTIIDTVKTDSGDFAPVKMVFRNDSLIINQFYQTHSGKVPIFNFKGKKIP